MKAVFESAVKLRAEDQRGFLERECAGDAELLDEMLALLSRHEASRRIPTSSGHVLTDQKPIQPRQIGRYEVLETIGRGGFGQVYKAFDRNMDRTVAIKVMNAPEDMDLVRRFCVEAKTVANFQNNNIVTVFDFGEENGAPYLVMEFLNGTNLEELVKAGTLSLYEKVRIMSEVATGLDHAHHRGVIHRDVKPANIMLLANGSVKIMDFGISKLANQAAPNLTQTGLVIGSPRYMAPEQFNGVADELSDEFAFGVTFYEILTGVHPFAHGPLGYLELVNSILRNTPRPLRSIVPDCPERIETVVNRALAKTRESRFKSLSDVEKAIRPALLDLGRKRAPELIRRAAEMLAANHLDAALIEIRKGLDLDASNDDANQLQLQIEHALNRREQLERAGVLLRKAEQEIGQRDFESAAQCLADVRELGVDEAGLVARLEKGEVQVTKARSAERLLEAARDGLQNEDLTRAFRCVSEVLVADPANPTGQLLLQQIQEQMSFRDSRRKIQAAITKIDGLLLIGEIDQAFAIIADVEAHAAGKEKAELADLRARALRQRESQLHEKHLTEGVRRVRTSIKTEQFDSALSQVDLLLRDFPGNTELSALRKHTIDQITLWKWTSEAERLKREASVWIERGEYDRAIRALELGVAELGDDGELTRLLQTALERKADLERKTALAGIVEECQRLRALGKRDDALSLIERATKRWDAAPEFSELRRQLSQEQEQNSRLHRVQSASRQAEDLIRQKKPESAATLLRETINIDGETPELRRLLEEAEGQIREYSRASKIAAIQTEAKRFVQGQRLADALGALNAGLKEFPNEAALLDARATVARAIEREKGLSTALQEIGRLERDNRCDAAAELADRSLRDFGADSRLREIRDRLSAGVFERQRAEQLRREIEEFHSLLGRTRFDDAIRFAEACEVRYPGEKEILGLAQKAQLASDIHRRKAFIDDALTHASECLKRGDVETGFSILSDAAAVYPDSSELQRAVEKARVSAADAQRKRELNRVIELTERAMRDRNWDNALERVADGLTKFPKEIALELLKSRAEKEKYQFEVDELTKAVLAKVQSGDLAGSARDVAAGLVRWPGETRLRELENEIQIKWAEDDIKEGRALLLAGRHDEAQQKVADALKHRPGFSGARDLAKDIASRLAIPDREPEAESAVHPVPRQTRTRRILLGVAALVTIAAASSIAFFHRTPSAHVPTEVRKAPLTADLKIAGLEAAFSATTGSEFSQQFRTIGGSPPISWSVAQGALPGGISLSGQTGVVSGFPDKGGSFPFVLQASDSAGRTVQRSVSLTVEAPASIPSEAAIPNATPAKKAAPDSSARTVGAGNLGADAKRKSETPAVIQTAAPTPVQPAGQTLPKNPETTQTPCKLKPFSIDEYADLRSGELTWTGSLPTDGQLEIKSRQSSTGSIRGDILPAGVPIRVTVGPASIRPLAVPSLNNCWDSRLLLQNSGQAASRVTIRWTVYQP